MAAGKGKKTNNPPCGGPRGQVPHLQHLPLPKKFNTLSFYATELVFYRRGLSYISSFYFFPIIYIIILYIDTWEGIL